MKHFATYGITREDVWETLAGPNIDYDGQSKLIKDMCETGSDKYDRVEMIAMQPVKRRRLNRATEAIKFASPKPTTKKAKKQQES